METKDNKKELVYLPIKELYPHPDNPRKEIGDITELAESIKVKGIMQNLTVVKGHREGEQYVDSGYTVIIGHRRLAASKKAGLSELPCVIAEMSQQDQVVTMLLENMQRSDLTVYEQAKGFQMMLDFGDTVETVAEKSGFSQTTIRRRVKLLELDEEKFKKAEKRGATIFDYVELEKIKDPKLKNEVLDSIGTNNFNYSLKNAIQKEENKKYMDFVESEVSKFAVKIDSPEGYDFKRNYGTYNREKELSVPEDRETVDYFYRRENSYLSLYVKKDDADEKDDAEEKRKQEERDKREEKLRDISDRSYELRADAVNCISNSHAINHISDITEFMCEILFITQTYRIKSILGIDESAEEYSEMTPEEFEGFIKSEIKRAAKEKPGKLLLKIAYELASDGYNSKYFSLWPLGYLKNSRLDVIYNFLNQMGYEMSDEEKMMQNGTHPLLTKESEK